MRRLKAFPLAFALALAGCVTPAARIPSSPPSSSPTAPLAETAPATYTPPCATPPTTRAAAFECDRASILAMAGEFRVRFAFDETAALAPGYTPHATQRSGASELVVVIEDTGRHISLQHILVLGKDHTVVKHWRQDWQFEPTQRLRFRGLGRFETKAVAAADAAGAWSQTVYEVDDAPRYWGVGRWVHAGGEDAWESDRSWRPLPRREYTRRSDYQVLDVVNRHALTPAGWIHEQDNTKIAIAADGSTRALARERGLNSYTRITDYDFAAGRDYWRKTATYWSSVRAEWARYETAHPDFTTSPEPNGEPRIEAFFTLAEHAEQGGQVAPQEIRALFATYMNPIRGSAVGAP